LNSTFDYIQQAIQHISQSSTNFQKTLSLEVRLFVTLLKVQHATHLTRFIQIEPFGSLEVYYIFNESSTLADKIIII